MIENGDVKTPSETRNFTKTVSLELSEKQKYYQEVI